MGLKDPCFYNVRTRRAKTQAIKSRSLKQILREEKARVLYQAEAEATRQSESSQQGPQRTVKQAELACEAEIRYNKEKLIRTGPTENQTYK